MSISTGWIKLHRQTLDSDVFADAELLRVFIWCLLRASHKPQSVPMQTGRGRTVVRIEAGQFVFGRNKAAQELGLAPTTLWRRILRLQSFGSIAVKTDNHYSVISIVNWDTFQGVAAESGQANGQTSGQPSGQPTDNQRTGNGHIQEGKESKECKDAKKEREEATASAPALLLELVDGWNSLPDGVVKPGNGARREPPAEAVLAGWKRVQRNREQREAFQDIPAVLAAIRTADFCHGQGWFNLPWLFSTKQKQFNIVKLLSGAYENTNGNGHRQPNGADYNPNRKATKL